MNDSALSEVPREGFLSNAVSCQVSRTLPAWNDGEMYLAVRPLDFQMKLGGRDGDSVTSWDGATCFFLSERWSPEMLGKYIGALLMLVRLCCKFFLLGASDRVAMSAHCWERMC